MRIIFHLAFLILFVGCEAPGDLPDGDLAEPSLGNNGSSSTTPTGKWATTRFPINVVVSDSFSQDEADFLTEMSDNWNVASGNEFNFMSLDYSGVTNKDYASLSDFYDDEMGIYKSNSWYPELGIGTLAVTQYFGYIIDVLGEQYVSLAHADIILNTRDHTFTTDATFGTYDLPSVVLHEMGHFLGLKHETNPSYGSVMYPSISAQNLKRIPVSRDEYLIQENYDLIVSEDPLVMFASALKVKSEFEEGTMVRGIIELKKDGHCVHKLNDKVIHQHKLTLP